MLPHRKLGASNGPNAKWLSPSERRFNNGRVPTHGEVLIAWSHAKDSPLRYRLLDISEGGMRIHSLLPVHEGMTGVALSLLPSATALNRSFQIMWCRRCAQEGGGTAYEAGVRFTPAT
ncbi:MAG: PilZ domain-containing protein [Phycisphaerae bacterium]|jgi:c-di-GMP-binding flagellar brake protein YcgR|nr:PilZ domain-containing protein [Phycisphaerae bacterium]